MEPQVQYAKTSDGVNIAFASMGEGPPLVVVSQWLTSHVRLEWDVPLLGTAWSYFAQHMKVVRFDGRGVGLSDRDVTDFSLEARIRDLEAVLNHLGFERFALVGIETGGLAALAYASRFPSRVSHLALINCYPKGELWGATLRGRSFVNMIDDWELMTETVGALAFGFNFDGADEYARFVRQCTTPEIAGPMLDAEQEMDLSSELKNVEAPTLVVRHDGIQWIPMKATRELAAGIRDSRLHVVDGHYQDTNVLGTVLEFLGAGELGDQASGALRKEGEARPQTGAVHTILFTDVEGSTALTDRLGDAKARDLLREHERMTRDALNEHGGSEVKTMGDGFMASFSSATKALDCAIALQKSFADRSESAREPINIRIGLNAGEPIEEDDPGGRGDLFGTAVNMAARIAAKADGGEILVSNVVRELVAGKNFLFNDRGETELRGFEDPVRLFEVRWSEGD